MGVISRIRNNTGLLIGAIGIGVAGFVIMDMTNNQGISGGEFNVAEVNGKKISLQEFRNAEQTLYAGSGGDTYAQKDYLYEFFVEKIIIEQEADALGLGVSKEELIDLQFGTRLSPIIQQRFTDPQTGQVSREQLASFQQQIMNNTMDPNLRAFWAIQEGEIIKNRLESKLSALVSKSLYTPTFIAERISDEQTINANVLIATVPYFEIPDDQAKVTDEDIKEYMKSNKALYAQKEETRSLSYVVFNVVPTFKDTMEYISSLEGLKEEFAITKEDSLFAVQNYGEFSAKYFKKDELSPRVAEMVLEASAGEVVGPFIDGSTVSLIKIIDRKTLPDSVRSRHILLTPRTQEEAQVALERLDSIKTALESKTTTFEAMAKKYSRDGSAAEGGDLGYAAMGMMVKPYNDLIFYKAKEGEYNLVGTDFGFHLVEVTGKKFLTREEGVKLAIISEQIVPSSRTQDEVRDLALQFVSENPNANAMNEAARQAGVAKLSAKGIKSADHTITGIGQGGGTRSLVQWLFESSTKVGDVSPDAFAIQNQGDFYISKYVVAALDGVKKEGEVNIEDIREAVTPILMNQKKAKIVNQAIEDKTFVQAVGRYNAKIDTFTNITFSNLAESQIRYETEVIGHIFSTPLNGVSPAIAGNLAIFIVSPIYFSEPQGSGAAALIKQTNNMSSRSMVRGGLMPSLVNASKVKDQRSILY
jgi:peptidyl-prolyl cis-trans isomerase D